MSKQQLKIFVMTVIVCAFLALIGTSYAYYELTVVSNANKSSVSVESQYLSLKYVDGGDGVFSGDMNGYLFPGDTFTKKFIVKNDGDGKVKFNIVLRDVENTFTRTSDWTYTLKLGTTVLKEDVTFPNTSREIIYTKEISAQTNEEYTLIVNYANVGSDEQQVDWTDEKVIKATIDIEVFE